MGDSYSEVIIKRKDTTTTLALKTLLIIVACFVGFVALITGGSLLPFAFIIIYLLYIIYNRLNIEYEYIYVNGELEIDKIMGRAKRKKLLTIEFEKVEMIAPKGSHALDSYNNGNCKVIDYTSRVKDVRPYVVVTHKDNTLIQVMFEPNQKMLDDIKTAAPRKMSTF